MLKKIVVVCSLLMLLSTMAVAAPAKGKFVVTAPLIGVNGIVGLGDAYDGYSFGDDGSISLLGTSQADGSFSGYPVPMTMAAPWAFGYMLTDNIELGLNFAYVKFMDGSDSLLNLGVYGVYYLKMNKLMPFVKLGVTRVDVTDDAFGSDTLINTSIGVAYALSQTVAPYFSIDFNTVVDTGTMVNLTFGLKFML